MWKRWYVQRDWCRKHVDIYDVPIALAVIHSTLCFYVVLRRRDERKTAQ